MTRFSRGSSRPHVQTRRKTAWDVGPGGVTSTQFTASSSSIIGAGVTPAVPGLTWIRIRGELEIFLVANTAAADGMQGALGLALVTTAAFNQGIAALPRPINDAEGEFWLWHQFVGLHGSIASDPRATVRYQVDSKAMRKFDQDMTVVMIGSFTESGTADMRIMFDSRVLVKLP